MQVAHINRKPTNCLSQPGQTVLIVLTVLAAACLAGILAGLAATDLLRYPASGLLACALSLCIGGVALAIAGVLFCFLASFLEKRTLQPTAVFYTISLAQGYAASNWRAWTELRPPRFSI
jgi:uncharacterized membrane protein